MLRKERCSSACRAGKHFDDGGIKERASSCVSLSHKRLQSATAKNNHIPVEELASGLELPTAVGHAEVGWLSTAISWHVQLRHKA